VTTGRAGAAEKAMGVEVTRAEHGAAVSIDGDLFTEYRIDTGPKPICWPVMSHTGKRITRAYPMEQVTGEKDDHPHQRSWWFTHGNVNGIDFWAETPGHGSIKHREFVALESGPKLGLIRTRNDWLGPDGKKVCEDERELRFHYRKDARLVDYDVTVTASEGPVTFGDTKEGAFGIRVPTSMDVEPKPGGTIVNSRGQRDDKAWGQKAEWVDYYGPVEGETLGIAILNHPSSFRFPTYWHVRTYGLFAANPFGLHDFTGMKDVNGSYMIPKSEAITFRYRVYFHSGDTEKADVAGEYSRYAAEK
jgi:hypothetical protein